MKGVVVALTLPQGAEKREFRVTDAPSYDQRSPVRWLLSHLARYPLLLVSFAVAAVLTNVLFSAVPRLSRAPGACSRSPRSSWASSWFAV